MSADAASARPKVGCGPPLKCCVSGRAAEFLSVWVTVRTGSGEGCCRQGFSILILRAVRDRADIRRTDDISRPRLFGKPAGNQFLQN